MPLPSARTIPVGWSRHHERAATGGMNATGTVGSKGAPVYDAGTDSTTASWSSKYVGPMRVQALTGSANPADAGGQQIVGREYLVQLTSSPGADLVVVGDRVKVLSAVNDAAMVGQDLWVVDFQMGSERFTRDLVCSDNESDAPTAVS